MHISVKCDTCSKGKTCKDIQKIKASSYSAYREQMVKFVPHDDPTAIRGNRTTADEQNRAMVRKLQKDKGNLKRVKQEMEKLMKQGFIKSLKDLTQETQNKINSGPKHFIPTSIAYKETSSASTTVRIF